MCLFALNARFTHRRGVRSLACLTEGRPAVEFPVWASQASHGVMRRLFAELQPPPPEQNKPFGAQRARKSILETYGKEGCRFLRQIHQRDPAHAKNDAEAHYGN